VTAPLLALSPTTLPDTPPLEYVEAAAAAGYDAVGLRLNRSPLFPFHPVAGNASLIRELKQALAGSGLSALDMLSFYLAPATDVAEFAAPLEAGAALGARYALVAGDDADASRLRDNLARFCDLARPFGVTAAVEFAVIRPLATLGQTLQLLADAGRENAVVCLDPLNHIRGGGTVAELRAVDPAVLPYGQISARVLGTRAPNLGGIGRMSPNQPRLLGEGTLPLHEILDALPPGRPLSVELPMPKTKRRSARKWAHTTADSTRRFLDAHALR